MQPGGCANIVICQMERICQMEVNLVGMIGKAQHVMGYRVRSVMMKRRAVAQLEADAAEGQCIHL